VWNERRKRRPDELVLAQSSGQVRDIARKTRARRTALQMSTQMPPVELRELTVGGECRQETGTLTAVEAEQTHAWCDVTGPRKLGSETGRSAATLRPMRLLHNPGRALLILAALAATALLAGGCMGDDDTEAFEREVVSARDTTDSSFAYIKRPESTEDLVRRLRTSGQRIERVSGTLADADAPADLADEHTRLVTALDAMSEEMNAAANSIELVNSEDATAGFPVETLVFDTWDSVQNVLTELREEGVDVQPLRPGGGP